MSQHFLNTSTNDGRKVEVFTGWDRPLQGFFLVVEQKEPAPLEDDESEGLLFSNLMDLPLGQSHPKTFDVFEDALKEFGITIPPAMMESLLKDRAENAGNRRVIWSENGQILNAHSA